MAKPIDTPFGPMGAVANWLRANDIDPSDVPIEGPISIERDPLEGRSIRYAAMLRNQEGFHYADRATGAAAREERTVPLKAEPEGLAIDGA